MIWSLKQTKRFVGGGRDLTPPLTRERSKKSAPSKSIKVRKCLRGSARHKARRQGGKNKEPERTVFNLKDASIKLTKEMCLLDNQMRLSLLFWILFIFTLNLASQGSLTNFKRNLSNIV